MTRGRRLLVAAAAVVVLGGAWWGLPVVARKMSLFRVRRVDVVGSRYLTAGDVARAAEIPPGSSIFDDTEPLRLRVLAIRGVRNVTVRRRLPGALEFDILEFEPVAQMQGKSTLVLLDRRGRPLPFDPTRGPVDLPLAEPDSAVTGLVERVEEAEPEFHKQVQRASRERDMIVLETDRHRVLFRIGAGAAEIQGAAAVIGELARRRMVVREVDARFEGRILVRGGRG